MSSRDESRMSAFMRAAPWVSGLVLVAGVVSALVVFVGRDDESSSESAAVSAKPSAAAKPAPSSAEPAKAKTVPLDPKAPEVAGRFILTNVTRKNLAEGWTL